MPACASSACDAAGHGSLTSSGLTCSFAVVIVEHCNGTTVSRPVVLRDVLPDVRYAWLRLLPRLAMTRAICRLFAAIGAAMNRCSDRL